MTVLLVEDTRDVLVTLRDLLMAKGHEVLCAQDGVIAIHVLQSHPGAIDLLISDIVMPELDGDELAEAAQTIRPGLKILLMSGGSLRPVSEMRLPEEIKIVNKPFTGRVFLEKVESLMAEPAAVTRS